MSSVLLTDTVIYVAKQGPRPALVVKDNGKDNLNLMVFLDGFDDRVVRIEHDAEHRAFQQWCKNVPRYDEGPDGPVAHAEGKWVGAVEDLPLEWQAALVTEDVADPDAP